MVTAINSMVKAAMDVEMESNDSGGVATKHGFIFQDCVAAYYVTQMLRDKKIQRIRCEVTDDVDVVCDDFVEFVQVKTTTKAHWARNDLLVLSTKVPTKRRFQAARSYISPCRANPHSLAALPDVREQARVIDVLSDMAGAVEAQSNYFDTQPEVR